MFFFSPSCSISENLHLFIIAIEVPEPLYSLEGGKEAVTNETTRKKEKGKRFIDEQSFR